ncbi:MAG: HAMP domain-containing histidine kinase [Proteobacteria bacterium]|nr:MAG: HAMP domain-containing histidine kinase [Pseudomonadota bacterium]
MEKDSVCADEIQLTSPVSRFLLSEAEAIMLAWESHVRKEIAGTADTPQPILIDTLPLFLSNLAQALDAHHPRALATDSSTVAKEHGGERARITDFTPAMILKEYQILREIIFERLDSNNFYNRVIFTVIHKSFDQAVQEAMTAYFATYKKLNDQFVATLTHDLRNPVGAAKLSADFLGRNLKGAITGEQSEKLKILADRASRNLLRTDRMIQYLLDSNEVQAGKSLLVNLTQCNLATTLLSTLNDLPETHRKRIKILSEDAVVLADEPLIRRAVDNLLSNAFKYGASDKPVSIKISTFLGRVLISVHNEGNPIPQKEHSRIFQVSHRTDSAIDGEARGWGLGLAFVRAACEAHGGCVSLDSAPQAGTTFTIDIPIDGNQIKDSKKERRSGQ